MSRLRVVVVLVCAITLSNYALANDRENTVCGVIKERLLFKIWSSVTPDPERFRPEDREFIEDVSFKTSDGRLLKGYMYRSHDRNTGLTEPKGYILMALGNAMISGEIITSLWRFARRGYDVYAFDYRGYGRSEGKRRINAFIQDYRELVEHLNPQYQIHLLYGISLGGAVVLNVIGLNVYYDRATIDSSPSRFSKYGCPEDIDPIRNFPDIANNIQLITGAIDPVLKRKMTSELWELGESRGASVFHGPNYSHPFMDFGEVHAERLNRIIDFLDQAEVEN